MFTDSVVNSNGTDTGQVVVMNAVQILRPTLLVVAGGTGHRIALYLKALFVEAYGAVPPGFRIVAFDTDDEALAVQVNGQAVQLTRNQEFFYIGKVPVASIIQHIDNLPTIRERIPTIEQLPPLALLDGAGQNRLLGLLALLWHYDLVQRVVRDNLWELTHRENLGELGGLRIDASRGINIIQAGSLCGGTNSGQFLDLAYLVRSELDSLGELADFSSLVGLGVLPDAFRHASGANMVPNTVAALEELNHAMLNGGFEAPYRNGAVVETLRPPFDLFYVQGAVAEDGRTQLHRDELCRTIARGLYHLALSPIGGRQRSIFDNVKQVLTGHSAKYGTFLASFGVAELSFPSVEMINWCATRQASLLLQEGLLAEPTGVAAATGVTSQNLGLDAAALYERLAVDDSGLRLMIELSMPARWRELTPGHLPSRLISYVQSVERERLEGDFRLFVRENASRLGPELEKALIGRVHEACTENGFRFAHLFAVSLTEMLDGLAHGLTARRQRVASEMSEQEQALTTATGELNSVATGDLLVRVLRFLGLDDPASRAAERYLHSANEFLTARLEMLTLDHAISVVVTAREALRPLVSELERFLERAQLLVAQFSKYAWRKDWAPPGWALVDEAYLLRLYEQYQESSEALMARLQPSYEWLSLTMAELEEMLRSEAKRPFEPLAAMTIEDAIVARGDELSASERLELLVQMAQPAWNIEETRLPHGGSRLARLTLLGVPDADHSCYAGDGSRLVSTGDKQRITALTMTAGAPLSALRNFREYQREYELARQERPLHLLPKFV